MRLILLAVIFILTTNIAVISAQSHTQVTGTVTDEKAGRVPATHVEALNLATWQITTAISNSAGQYSIKLAPGDYRVFAIKEGFATAAKNLAVTTSASLTEDFVLSPGVVQESVTVTATRGGARLSTETAQPLTVASTEAMQLFRPVSPMEAIRKTPNLIAIGANPVATRPRLRGLASNRLLIMLDGERLNNVRSDPLSGISLSVVDVTRLDSVEVVSGAGSALYGSDAIAGTINLITRSPARASSGQHLGLRVDGDARTNGAYRRGSADLNWSVPQVAVRLGTSMFRLGNYSSGNQPIDLDEVVSAARFANDMGNASNNNVARTFAVWQLPANAEIPNGQGHGFDLRADVWLFDSQPHSIRYRQLNSRHKDVNFAFITPPFDPRRQSNAFRRFDVYGVRYEGTELHRRVPHVAVNYYFHKYSFPDETITNAIDQGSSWDLDQDLPVITGNVSSFTPAAFTHGRSTVASRGFEGELTLIPFSRAWFTTGVGYAGDSSRDEFSRGVFLPPGFELRNVAGGRASTPDSSYRNFNWFNVLEYDFGGRVRLTGSFRLDNWRTRARVTDGFPLGAESAILAASFEQLTQQPGDVDVAGASGILQLLQKTADIQTSRTSTTGSIGAVVTLLPGINAYARWGSAYREPGITERYILRDFGDPTFSVLLVPNTRLQPERNNNYEVGVKTQRKNWTGSFGYFRNNLSNFIGNSFSETLFVPADPDNGLDPISPFFPFHGVLYVQRTNTARARIQGFEGAFEASVKIGNLGKLIPFTSMGYLKGTDLTPSPTTLALIDQFYNRPNSPVPLHGSASDAPLSSIAPFSAVSGVSYVSRNANWVGYYEQRYHSRITRVDPLDLSTALSTQYGSFGSLNSSLTHFIRAAYNLHRENYRMTFSFGIDNLTDRLYFDPFQTAPASGRSFTFGVSFDSFNLLRGRN
ncbi:MAG TPA: TonB-dependent receptor [Pyrinomonadaceae bacterium]|nr:TonB-dependent receptor [Pyrinomonadaceae bacterium]